MSLAKALATGIIICGAALAQGANQDLLVQLVPGASEGKALRLLQARGTGVEKLVDGWMIVKAPVGLTTMNLMASLKKSPLVAHVQPNYAVHLLNDYKVTDSTLRAKILSMQAAAPTDLPGSSAVPADNPPIPQAPGQGSGVDPDFSKQWGMNDIGVSEAWRTSKGNLNMIVAVIDTGVDYTHPDLLPNLWRNAGEDGPKATNGIDDDGNGYIDDTIGWDFSANDNKPFDLPVDPWQMLLGGGNPGHGTHCAGNVAARADNGIGIAGVAPNVKIMSLRFISEKGQGTTADAIKAIKYAVDNGAKVLSNSWGSEGEDANEGAQNKALRDAISYAEEKGVIFIAAAGNGHQGVGYDNDSDAKPAYPASYDHANIVSVAALNKENGLGAFSNWGARSVDLGAPGVAVYSTTVGGGYNDKVIDIPGLITATWDGTSMACPHVAGAAALYWSAHPTATVAQVKAALISSAKPIPALSGKSVSNGKLDAAQLMR